MKNKSNFLGLLTLVFTVFSVMYLFCAFGCAELDFREWSDSSRILVCVAGFFTTWMLLLVYSDIVNFLSGDK